MSTPTEVEVMTRTAEETRAALQAAEQASAVCGEGDKSGQEHVKQSPEHLADAAAARLLNVLLFWYQPDRADLTSLTWHRDAPAVPQNLGKAFLVKDLRKFSSEALKLIKKFPRANVRNASFLVDNADNASFRYLLKEYRKSNDTALGIAELIWRMAKFLRSVQVTAKKSNVINPYEIPVEPYSSWRARQDTTHFLLPLDKEPIFVGTEEQAAAVLADVKADAAMQRPISFDCEWAGTVSLYDDTRLGIMQLATKSAVYVIDACAEPGVFDFCAFATRLLQLTPIIGFGVMSDRDQLKSAGVDGELVGQRVLDVMDTVAQLQQTIPVPPTYPDKWQGSSPRISLADLVQGLVGVSLAKHEQLADWERRPLRPESLHYAALDAYVLLQVLDILSKVQATGQWPNFQVVGPGHA
ncbi:uncharacterized protein MONBRDRAFT_38582 [Monosiga brevicollis MX1]|uniref:3'-5' exonuclease domain-containing protein n=1 Tax=Monosiga brevicollis TaxID=81824 RepID=A9V8W7_MONBE|nr:uncharacterized protein MONBRDRAFT_38582 [Monosiga brevicollis MX1]EDQ86031.1 predicted protein [Monosiga brevicollis MX1]|eukprot:XP_001749225.1 hypothetical protein [Monosiga brevicollis MX1]